MTERFNQLQDPSAVFLFFFFFFSESCYSSLNTYLLKRLCIRLQQQQCVSHTGLIIGLLFSEQFSTFKMAFRFRVKGRKPIASLASGTE